MTNNKKFVLGEIGDLLSGVAFPIIVQAVFSTTIVMFADYSQAIMWLAIVALVLGDAMLFGAYFIFGRKSGSVAYTTTVTAEKVREDGHPEFKKPGEYAPYKGFLMGLISVLPYIIFHIFYCIFPESTFLEFLLKFVFGWAIYPLELGLGYISAFSMFVAIIPVLIHGFAYINGKTREFKRLEVLRLADEARAAEFERMKAEREERAERQRAEQLKANKKKK